MRSVATGLLFVGVFGYAIEAFNPASPILISAGITLLLLTWKSRGIN